MVRKILARALASTVVLLGCLSLASTAGAASGTPLVLNQSAAFSVLGRSCGGIQEQVYATGFDASGYPAGDVYLKTTCGGSGRGGGYKSTTYTAWATVSWDWFGDTRTYAAVEGPAEGISTTFSAEDAHGDRVYNTGTAAYLEAGTPPVAPPAAPTGVAAVVSATEVEEQLVLSFQVSWTPAAETSGLISSSTVTATPVASTAPVLTRTVSGSATSTLIGPLQRHTAYQITVTSTDAEGTSQPSAPIEANSSGSEPPPSALETCEQNQGTIKLTPGLEQTPHVQSITIKGKLTGCDGSLDVSEGSYVAHLTTTEEVTCSALTSSFAEATTTPVSLLLKWMPKEAGSSKGTIVMPVSEAPGTGLSGTLEGGPFEKPQAIVAGSVYESFTGGPSCGVPPSRNRKAKPIRSGTFTTSQVEIGASSG